MPPVLFNPRNNCLGQEYLKELLVQRVPEYHHSKPAQFGHTGITSPAEGPVQNNGTQRVQIANPPPNNLTATTNAESATANLHRVWTLVVSRVPRMQRALFKVVVSSMLRTRKVLCEQGQIRGDNRGIASASHAEDPVVPISNSRE
eukprot:1418714-Amphidinium_carterae.1